MATYEKHIRGDFRGLMALIDHEIMSGSVSASLEGQSDYTMEGVSVAVRVYERYSWMGGNRLSLSVTLTGAGDALHLTAITAGGSQAVFFKVNTFGESAFLDKLVAVVEGYEREDRR